MLQELRTNALKTNGKTVHLSREIKDVKQNKMETLELENTRTKIQNIPGGLNSRMEVTEGRVSEPEPRSIETIQFEQQRKKY